MRIPHWNKHAHVPCRFFGQAHAIDAMLEMFESHMADKRLTSFHIAGDNGVGKQSL